MLNLIKKINLTKKLLTIAEMLSILKIQNLTKKLKIQKEDVYLKNDLFVTAGEVAQDLGISKPFAYKLVADERRTGSKRFYHNRRTSEQKIL